MKKTVSKNVMVDEVSGLVMADRLFVAKSLFLGGYCLATISASGGGSIGGVHLIFQGKNPKSVISWLCLALYLLKALF
jgi:hypothetical protein